MKALMIEGPGRAIVREAAKPEPGPGEIVVRVMRCGVCGTDFHIFHGTFLSPYPLIPGHEFAGVVDSTGAGVDDLAPGERVACDPTLYCGACEYCLSGRANHCLHWGATGDSTDGAMAEYVKVPRANAFRLPDALSFAEGAFIEPIACVVHGMEQLRLRPGRRVLLFGAGSMGQLLIQALAHAGASELAVVDIAEAKLAAALASGATRVYPGAGAAADLADRRGHAGFDAVVDATGAPGVIEAALQYLAPAGTYLQFGVAPVSARVPLSPFDLYHMDWKLVGSMAVNRTFRPALEWLAAGRFRVKPLISRVLRLEDVPALLAEGKAADVMKAQISFE